MRPLGFATTTFVAAIALAAPPALAQRQPRTVAVAREGDVDAAEAAYAPGFAAERNGQREEALRLFQDLWMRTSAPRAVARMGAMEIQLGRWVDGEAHVRQALARVDDPWIAAHRSDLERALQNARGHLTELTVTCNVSGALLTINGAEVGALPLTAPIRVPRGQVQLTVAAQGHAPALRTFVVEAEVSREHVDLVPSTRRPRAERTPEREATESDLTLPTSHGARSAFPARPLAVVSFVVGAVGVGLGAVSLALRNRHATAFNGANCWVDQHVVHGGCGNDYDAVQSWEALSIGGFVAGGVFVAGGLALWLASPGPTSNTALRCAPSLAAPGLSCALRF